MRRIAITALPLLLTVHGLADDPPVKSGREESACEDRLAIVAEVDPNLDSPLFHETKTSLNWWIVEDVTGVLEDTLDGEIGAEDLMRIEHTANCVSTHQGEHLMEFCEAVREGENLRLHLSGGMPAYASSLDIVLEPSLAFRCEFSAVYPDHARALRWKITSKKLRLKSHDLALGRRLFGWISVAFEETDDSGARPKTYKIEGYIKPVVLDKAE